VLAGTTVSAERDGTHANTSTRLSSPSRDSSISCYSLDAFAGLVHHSRSTFHVLHRDRQHRHERQGNHHVRGNHRDRNQILLGREESWQPVGNQRCEGRVGLTVNSCKGTDTELE
jgi:hypothetical protein